MKDEIVLRMSMEGGEEGRADSIYRESLTSPEHG